MKISTNKIIALNSLSIIIILGLFAATFFTQAGAVSSTHTVYYSENGYEPSHVEIAVGDTVTFVNNSEYDFWPASNPHPTHSALPALDPLLPVGPGERWSFVFTQPGVWGYHDHISSLHTGVVVVGEEGVSLVQNSYTQASDCDDALTNSEKFRCWEQVINYAYDQGSTAQAFATYEDIYRRSPSFAYECHSFTHIIGERAYDEFARTGHFLASDQLAYCSYGFFHGFIEAMMYATGDYSESRAFCDFIDEQVGDVTNVYNACLHGIGHGVTDGYDPRTAGDALGIVTPGLELCRTIGQTEYEVKLCATGVFNSLAILYDTDDNLTFDPDDPLAICREFSSEPHIKAACYDDMKTLLASIANHNLVAAAAYIEQIVDDEFAIGAIDNLATYHVYRIIESGPESSIADCYKLQPRLHAGCVRGLGAGYMVQGPPGQEYDLAISVCASSSVRPEHVEECFDRIMHIAGLRYSDTKQAEICLSVSDMYTGRFCP